MKEQAITQRLRHQIEKMESVFNLTREQFGRSSGASYTIGYEYHSTKGVKSSCVYLYNLPSKQKSPISFGLSFDFYTDEMYFQNRKLPIEEQTVTFSYCLNKKAKSDKKEVFKSKPYFLDETKNIIKLLISEVESTLTDQKKLDTSKFIDLLEKVAFNYEFEKQNEQIEKAINELSEPKRKLTQLENDKNSAAQSFETSKNKAHKESVNSAEYKLVTKLESELKIARENLNLKNKDIRKKYDLDAKDKNRHQTDNKFKKATSEMKLLVSSAISKFKISGRYADKLK